VGYKVVFVCLFCSRHAVWHTDRRAQGSSYANGWALAPAHDMNPVETGDGLKLNVSEADNSQSLDLALSVAQLFRSKLHTPGSSSGT
jgi:hypothetical protein